MTPKCQRLRGPPAALHIPFPNGLLHWTGPFTDPKEKAKELRRRVGLGEEEGTVANMPFPLVFPLSSPPGCPSLLLFFPLPHKRNIPIHSERAS